MDAPLVPRKRAREKMIVVLDIWRYNVKRDRWRATTTLRVPEDHNADKAKRQALSYASKNSIEVEKVCGTMPDEGQRVDHDLTQ